MQCSHWGTNCKGIIIIYSLYPFHVFLPNHAAFQHPFHLILYHTIICLFSIVLISYSVTTLKYDNEFREQYQNKPLAACCEFFPQKSTFNRLPPSFVFESVLCAALHAAAFWKKMTIFLKVAKANFTRKISQQKDFEVWRRTVSISGDSSCNSFVLTFFGKPLTKSERSSRSSLLFVSSETTESVSI